MAPTPSEPGGRLTRRRMLSWSAGAATIGAGLAGAPAHAVPAHAMRPDLGSGGQPMELAAVAELARSIGQGEPLALVDLAAVDQNVAVLRRWSGAHGVAWRPSYKTLQAVDLLAYVVSGLDRPRVMIHHLRNLAPALAVLPEGTDFLMGYPPSFGELERYVTTRRTRGEPPFTLRICIDGPALLDRLRELAQRSARPLPLEVVLEIDNGGPRGGFAPGAELAEALRTLRRERARLRLGALLCYDALAAGESDPVWRAAVARHAQQQLHLAYDQIKSEAADFVDVARLIRNGPGSANYGNWSGSTAANEFSAGSAVLFANYLDKPGYDTEGLAKALYLAAPVLRTPSRVLAGLPGFAMPAGYQPVFVKAGGWPTGNNPTLSKVVYPPDVRDEPLYGRGANSSGMVLAPVGALRLDDYVLETAQQVMEAQNYFAALHAVRGGQVRAVWPTLSRWSG